MSIELKTTRGLPTYYYRGRAVRTHSPKMEMPAMVPVVRRDGNEALLSYLGNPAQLIRDQLEKHILTHGEGLSAGSFSMRPIRRMGEGALTTLAEAAQEIIHERHPMRMVRVIQIAEIVFCRLGPSDQVLKEMPASDLDNLKWALSEEREHHDKPNQPRAISRTSFSGLDLSRLNYSRLRFEYCKFDGAQLNSANFRGAYFYDCSFSGADLRGADFEGAYFDNNMSFAGADIQGVNFSGATLDIADPSGAFQRTRGQGKGGIILVENVIGGVRSKAGAKYSAILGAHFTEGFSSVTKTRN